MCLSSCTGRSQHTSSAVYPPFSITTLVAREFASTHTVTSCLFVYQSPRDGSVWDVLAIISASIRAGEGLVRYRLIQFSQNSLPASHTRLQHWANHTLVSLQSSSHTGKRCSDGCVGQVPLEALIHVAIAVFCWCSSRTNKRKIRVPFFSCLGAGYSVSLFFSMTTSKTQPRSSGFVHTLHESQVC